MREIPRRPCQFELNPNVRDYYSKLSADQESYHFVFASERTEEACGARRGQHPSLCIFRCLFVQWN